MDLRPVLGTLGPEGSNHALIARGYLAERSATLALYPDFDAVLAAVAKGHAQAVLICAAHAACARVVGHGQFRLGLTLADCFLAESCRLAILTRADVAVPRSIAVQPATEGYADLSAWAEVIHVPTIVAAAEGLAAGRWHSALTAPELARGIVTRIDRYLGAPRDAWLVLTRPGFPPTGTAPALTGC